MIADNPIPKELFLKSSEELKNFLAGQGKDWDNDVSPTLVSEG
jgi:hypothetical protein